LKGLHDKARQYALKLLSYRGRSEKEIRERLRKKGFSKTVAASSINELKDLKLIDDMALAKTLKREALSSRLLSQKGAKIFMLQRGIPRDIVDEVFSFDENTDMQNAGRLMGKKLKALRDYPPEVARRRLYNLLLSRGYSTETIVTLFRDIPIKEDES
jgi:regulatory protein